MRAATYRVQAEAAVAFAPKLPRPRAQADGRGKLAEVALERVGIFARSFASPSEQPLVRVGAAPSHAAEHHVTLENDGLQSVIAKP